MDKKSVRLRETRYRHELKYYLSGTDYKIMSQRLKATMATDINAMDAGEYFIRSLYFDDLSDSAFREKLSGIDHRDKFRIRTYNKRNEDFKLERKRKDAGFILKDSLNLTEEEAHLLCEGSFSFLLRKNDSFARQMYVEFQTRQLRPCVIVDYVREPFVFPYGDVRVTFDKNIRTAYRNTDMFDYSLPTYSALVEPEEVVLEVKFNKFMPSYHAMLIQNEAFTRSAVSKYVLCRKYEL